MDARALDYETMENILIDWLAADGKVEVISPLMARQRLTDQQVKELQEGRPQALSEVARQLDADVLVQVQAHPTRQTRRGLQVRVLAEAINVRGGQSIGRAVVEVPPPLDKPQLNKYTRFLARRLMDGMTGSWRAVASDPGRDRDRTSRDSDRTMRPLDDRRSDPRRGDTGRDDSGRDRSLVDQPPTRPEPTTRPSAPPEPRDSGAPPTDKK
jgi:hypothetical protein